MIENQYFAKWEAMLIFLLTINPYGLQKDRDGW